MFKRYFLTGLLVLVPLAITIWVITSLIHFLDQTLIWLPYDYQPRNLFGFEIPGLGVVLTVGVILGIGLLASNLFGRQFLKLWEVILSRLPFVNSIYSSIIIGCFHCHKIWVFFGKMFFFGSYPKPLSKTTY